MSYDELLNLNDDELKNLILWTMVIYDYLKDKKLKYKIYDKYSLKLFKKYKSKKMTDNDKKCLALFLAGFKGHQYIYDIFKSDSNITLKKLCKYFKLDKNGNIRKYFDDSKVEDYYNDNFILFFSKIIRNIIYNGKVINAENIFCGVKNNDICGSNIIEHIFEYFGLESRESYKFEHYIFDEIEESGIQRINKKDSEENFETETKEKKRKKYNSKNYEEVIKYGIDLNEIEYDTNPALGREKEIDEIMASLLIENSVILTGDPAVGKTAIVEGLAYKIQDGNVHEKLKNLRIIKISSSSIVSGTNLRGSFEEKMENIIRCLMNDTNLIMFIDEMHTVIGAGCAEGVTTDMADILKPYLDRGQIKIIGSTTTEEYEKYISSDSAFKRRFERIKINELDNKVIKEILKDIIYKMEKTTNVKFNFLDENLILNTIIELTQNKYRVYNDKINNPDLSIKILKKAFAYAMLEGNEKVKINNVERAIRNCDRIYDSVRERYIKQLINTNGNIDSKPKVIEFVKK